MQQSYLKIAARRQEMLHWHFLIVARQQQRQKNWHLKTAARQQEMQHFHFIIAA